jgi:hypothetical protein
VGWVVVHPLLGDPQRCRGGQRLAAPQVAGPAREGAAGDLEPDAVPTAETMSGRPQIDGDFADAVWFEGWPVRGQAQQPIADVDRSSERVDVAEANTEVGVLQAGAHEKAKLTATMC